MLRRVNRSVPVLGVLLFLICPAFAEGPPVGMTVEERLRQVEQELAEMKAAQGAASTTAGQAGGAASAPVGQSSRRANSSEKNAPASALPAPEGEPFAWGDFTWMNGANRQHSSLLDTKYFTGTFMLDAYYTYSSNHPIDDTIVGSTATGRANEMQISMAAVGGDFHYGAARGSMTLQLGMRSTVVPRNDLSANRGQFDLATVYRYVREAYAGYHWDVLHGINLDVGIFMSYVGLFSYNNFENWAYQPSYTSDNTPWFFNGIRLQIFPTDRLKVELWLVNGWQSYAKFNDLPGVGYQVLYRPWEWLNVALNGYVGTDTPATATRLRFHSDNSLLVRYYNNPSGFITRAAFSLTGDLGFESGAGVTPFGGSGTEGKCTNDTPCTQNFLSGMFYHRIWAWKDHLGFTFGGGYLHNPGRYLVLVPPGAATAAFDTNPGTDFDAFDVSGTLDYMPDESSTWRIEVVRRQASVPYFAGPGGVTSPDGYTTTPLSPGWKPDQVKSETRFIAALLFRM